MTILTKDLKVRYEEEVKDSLKSQFGYENVNQIPKLNKIVINMGVGEAKENAKLLEAAVKDMEKQEQTNVKFEDLYEVLSK